MLGSSIKCVRSTVEGRDRPRVLGGGDVEGPSACKFFEKFHLVDPIFPFLVELVLFPVVVVRDNIFV